MDFNLLPANLRLPFIGVEFDNSRASQGPAIESYRALLIGQKTSGGTATADSIVPATSAAQVAALAGRGSMLHRMAAAWFAVNKSTELRVGVLADNGAGTAAIGHIQFAGTATAAGTIDVSVGGQHVQVAVAVNDSAGTIATNLAAALPSSSDYAFTGAVDGAVPQKVNITHRHKGAVGNELDIRVNYQDGEALPAGITATITAFAGGASNPTLTNLVAAMGDIQFHVVVHPYTDSTSLGAIEAELNDRWGPMRQIPGQAICAKAGAFSTLTTLGAGRNSPHSQIFSSPGLNPVTPPYEVAAQVGAQEAFSAANDPAQPFQTLSLPGVLAPAETDIWTNAERDLLLHSGIATTRVGPGSAVQIERAITTYQLNAVGSPDTSYLDATTMFTLEYVRYSVRALLGTEFPRSKLANDGLPIAAGQDVATPKRIRGVLFGWFRQLMGLALVENIEQFKNDLVVERDESNPNRVNILLPPDLVNQLITIGVKVQFKL